MDPTHPCFHFDMGHVHMNSQFHFGYCENVLFGFWKVRSVDTLIGSACGIFVMAILFEALKAYRERLYFDKADSKGSEISKKALIFGLPHIGQTALQIVQMILSYFLMLIVMYYNAWFFFAVVGGATLGYFCFGWGKLQMIQQQCNMETQKESLDSLEEQHKF